MTLLRKPIRRRTKAPKVGCPFCWEWIPVPTRQIAVYSGDGCLGGKCECGAAFALDETGRMGGQALLDAQAILCDGDLDRACELQGGVDVTVETRPYQDEGGRFAGRFGSSYMTPKVWFVKFCDS